MKDRISVPLTLYIHMPWCVRKCPYCDFNSHELKQDLPEKAYIDALLDDLTQDLLAVGGRQLSSIFIGGGTPSLFSPSAIERLLFEIQRLFPLIKTLRLLWRLIQVRLSKSDLRGSDKPE